MTQEKRVRLYRTARLHLQTRTQYGTFIKENSHSLNPRESGRALHEKQKSGGRF